MISDILSEISRRLPVADFYVSVPFWVALAVIVALFRRSPDGRAKQWLMLAFSICMLLTLPRFTWQMLLIFSGLCLVSCGCGVFLNGPTVTGVGKRRLTATAGVVGIVLVLAFFKYRFVQDALIAASSSVRGTDFVLLIGISYSSFKAIHFVVEGYKQTLKGVGLLEFLNYMFFFPSFISGPINRFGHFVTHGPGVRHTAIRDDLGPGLERIVHGLFKKTVLTTVLFSYTLTNSGTPVHEMPLWEVLLGLYAYAFYFYFDFSGYTDLAIGSARLMGFVLPENFDFPFSKRNIQQLWAHWHISLSSWLTDYLYWPLVRRMRKVETLRRHPLLVSNIAIIVTFVVCGLWHGEGLNFVFWGFYQGLGIAAVNVYQGWKRSVRDEMTLKYFQSSFSYYAGVVLTFNFFAIGLMMFVLDWNDILMVFGRFLTLS